MPGLERWEQKVIGQINRFENYTGELLTNRMYEGVRAGANSAVKGAMSLGRWIANRFAKPTKPQVIAGKKFNEDNISFGQKVGRRIGVAVANKVIDSTEKAVDTYLTRQYFFPNSKTAAAALFGGHITFDRAMGRNMYNAYGYEPGFDRVMQQLRAYAAEIGDGFTDITWRQKVVPHILQTAFQNELNHCLESIRTNHQQHPDVYNRQLMETQMHVATRYLGEIFEKFTLDLANKTDYLEAPLALLPKENVIPENVELTEEQRALLAAVPRHSLFDSEKNLQKRIAAESKKLPKPSADQVVEKFRSALRKPVLDPDGAEKPYQKGADPLEDERRLVKSVLTLREMMQQYESRNFFSKRLTRAGRAEGKAIQEMKALLCETMGVSPDQISTLLDLDIPLEENVDISQVMDIRQLPKLEKTFGDKVSDVMEKTNEIIRDVAGATLSVTGNMIKSTVKAIAHPIQTVNQITETLYNAAGNFFGSGTRPAMVNMESVPEEPMQEQEQNEQESKLEENEQELKHEEEEEPKHEDEQEPEPEKEEPEPEKEEPEHEEEKEQEVPKKESTSSWGWDALSYAASFFNPFSYEIFGGGKQADPLQQVQDKQKEVASQFASNPLKASDVYPAYPAMAKLLYYKTLEMSWKDGKITQEAMKTALTEDTVNKNAGKIMKEPAFMQMDMVQYERGYAAKINAFMEQVSKDPAAANEIHKDYMQKMGQIKAARAAQPKASVQQKPPEAAHAQSQKGPMG